MNRWCAPWFVYCIALGGVPSASATTVQRDAYSSQLSTSTYGVQHRSTDTAGQGKQSVPADSLPKLTPHQGTDLSFLSTYQQNYLLPAYHTQKPYQSYYGPHNPNDSDISHDEIKFQLSVKALLTQVERWNMQLYGAYTQRSYWQAYQKSAFFRESDYQPELFVAFLHSSTGNSFSLGATDVGFVHQSNGLGGNDERSWGRAYVRQTVQNGRWHFQGTLSKRIKSSYDYNPDIVHYLGNDILKAAYVIERQTLTLELHNQLSSGLSRGSETLSWSFPLFGGIKGFAQIFSGYGQSLGEYDHYTNAFGLGVSFADGF